MPDSNYVTITRFTEAQELFEATKAAGHGLLAGKRSELDTRLAERREALP